MADQPSKPRPQIPENLLKLLWRGLADAQAADAAAQQEPPVPAEPTPAR